MGMGEAASPESADIKRNDRHIDIFRDQFIPPLKFAQMPVSGECAFGEDTDDFPLFQLLFDRFECIFACSCRDWNDAEKFKNRLKIPFLVKFTLDDKTDTSR